SVSAPEEEKPIICASACEALSSNKENNVRRRRIFIRVLQRSLRSRAFHDTHSYICTTPLQVSKENIKALLRPGAVAILAFAIYAPMQWRQSHVNNGGDYMIHS